MAVITQTNSVYSIGAPVTVTRTVLTASDTFTYVRGSGQMLVIRNSTGAALNAGNIVGATTDVSPNIPGLGGSVSGTGGKALSMPDDTGLFIKLDDLFYYLSSAAAGWTGVVTLSGLTGATAALWTK